MSKVKPKRIHHVAIIVDDLQEAGIFATGLLGLEPDGGFEDAARAIKVGFFRSEFAVLEFVEVLDPERRRAKLGDAKARIDHIALEVDNAKTTYDELTRAGVEFREPYPDAAAGNGRSSTAPRRSTLRRENIVLFTRPETTDGVEYQFIEVHDKRP
jgi:catechol 2,3-dioxygenase-like lactoylglutathione lyase family enzyme